MAYLFDSLKPKLQGPLIYSEAENRAIVPFNVFMTLVSEHFPVQSMDKRDEMLFCLYVSKVLEHAWKRYSVTPPGQSEDASRFLEILVRYLLNAMKNNLGCVIAFLEKGKELEESEMRRDVILLAHRSFEGFVGGNVGMAFVLKQYIDRVNAAS